MTPDQVELPPEVTPELTAEQAAAFLAPPVEDLPAPTEEQVPARVAELVGCLMRYISRSNNDVQLTLAVMLFSRHLYAVALHDLNMRINELTSEQKAELAQLACTAAEVELQADDQVDEAFALVPEGLAQAVRAESAKPFTESHMIPAFEDVVKPWFSKVVAVHAQREQEAKRAAWEAQEKIRRAHPIPLNISFGGELGPNLSRSQAVVLVGWMPAVQYLLNQVTNYVITTGDEQVYCVVRFCRNFKPNPEEAPLPRLVPLGDKDWVDCAKSRHAAEKLFISKIVPQLREPVDLLVVDDATQAAASHGLLLGAGAASVETVARKGTQAHKMLRAFTQKIGSGLILGLPLDSQFLPDLALPVWSELNEHACLRTVECRLRVGEDCYDLVVNGAVVDTVAVATLEQQVPSKLILPS